MSALSFVNLDGSPQLESLGKKLVRAHVARHFHPKRRSRQGQQSCPVGNQRQRIIAPNMQPVVEQCLFSEEATTATQPLGESQSVSSADLIPIGSGHMTTVTHPQAFQPARDQINQQIDPAAVVDLLSSGASREKNLRIGFVQGKNTGVLQTFARGSSTPPGIQGRSFGSKTKDLDFILPCPYVVDLLLPPSLVTPTVASVSPQARYIVEQYAATVDSGAKVRGLLPSTLPLRNDYMPAARNHDALWYASVSFASAMKQIIQGVAVDSVSLKYKGEAIRAINSNLRDLSRRITDETIAAVQCLASIECVCGNFDAFQVHLGAVREMVQLRGGLETLGFNGLLSRLVQMHEWRWDLVAHNVQQDDNFCSIRAQPQPGIPSSLLIFILGSPITESLVSTRAVSTLLLHLQNLALTWDTQACFSSSSATTSFVEGCNRLYDQTSILEPPDKPKELWTTADYEFQCFRLACLIYSSKGAETEQTRLDKRRTRLQELYQHLNRTEMSKYWTDIPGALIWCLAVGANESCDTAEYSWFMAQLIPMLMMLSMECWNDLQRSLGTFGWLLKCGRAGVVLARL